MAFLFLRWRSRYISHRLVSFPLAEVINYKVRFKKKTWSSDLANPVSLLYRELEDEIQEMVNMHVAVICLYRSRDKCDGKL